jgi:hypothetical protein
MRLSLKMVIVLLTVAGVLLLLESLLGCFYVLGIGFATPRDVLLDLCLTMAFPIYLLCLFSLWVSSVGLWLFFALQWLNTGFDSSHPGYVFVNPFGWLHGDFSFLAAVLVSFSTWALWRLYDGDAPGSFLDVLQACGEPKEIHGK